MEKTFKSCPSLMGKEATQQQSYKNYYFRPLQRPELVENSEPIQGTTTWI